MDGRLPSVSRSPLGLASRGPSFAQSSSLRYHVGTERRLLVHGAAHESLPQYEPNRACLRLPNLGRDCRDKCHVIQHSSVASSTTCTTLESSSQGDEGNGMAMDASVSARGYLYNRFEAADLGFWKQEVVEPRHLSLDGALEKAACICWPPPQTPSAGNSPSTRSGRTDGRADRRPNSSRVAWLSLLSPR